MLVKTDLHVHSVLSACADKDNTVNNIVNLGVLLDTRILALSDHNSCLNFPAFKQVCVANGILAVPAMEVTTAEEIHVLCLFKNYQDAKTLNDEIFDSLFKIDVDTEFYNPQNVLDKDDNVTDTVPYLLNIACKYDIYSLVDRVNELGGMAIPAHVDRDSFSVISVLGDMPDDLNVRCVEVTSRCPQSLLERLKQKYNLIQSSDAHCLEDMVSNEFYLDLDRMSINALFERLQK